MWKNVEKCGKMWKNVEKCGKMWKMWKMWKNVEKRTVTPFCTELYGYRSQHRNMIIRFLKLHFCSLNQDPQMCNEFFFHQQCRKKCAGQGTFELHPNRAFQQHAHFY